MSSVVSLDSIRSALARYEPNRVSTVDKRQAAVAVVLRPRTAEPELLVIERARRAGDPWSGHMAFPGGRVDASDADARCAAERETLEEVGLPLDDAEYLGRLDDMEGRPGGGPPGLVISAFVYCHAQPRPLVPNHEVREALWIPFAWLLDPSRHVEYGRSPLTDAGYPGIVVGVPDRQVVWGLTYRILEGFLRIVDRPLPDRWQAFR